MTKINLLAAGLLLLQGANTQAQSADVLSISPATGTYFTSQSIDLSLFLQKSGVTIQSMTALANNADVTTEFNQCRIQGSIVSGGISYRCPGVGLNVLPPGLHTFTVTLQLSDGSTANNSVQWTVLQNSE